MNELTVAAVQSIATPGDLAKSAEDHARLSTYAASSGARLAVFPELSLTGYDRRLTAADAIRADEPRLNPLRSVVDSTGITLIAGAPVLSPSGLHIAALCFIPNEKPVIYTKQYLHEGEEIAFLPGSGGPTLSVHDRTVSIAICAEITHPKHAEGAAKQGAEIYAASCFITPAGYKYDTNLLEGYAHAHRMAVIMANYGAACAEWDSGGGSAIWSSSGELLAQAPSQGEAVIIATLVFP